MLQRHPIWRSPIVRLAPVVLCMAAIFALSSRSELPKPPSISGEVFSNMGHFGAYFVLGITIWWVLGLARCSPRSRALLAWGLAVLYGFTDEFHQSFVPHRTPDIRDIIVDAIGAAFGIWIAVTIARRFGPEQEETGGG